MMADEGDEVLVVMERGKVVRSQVGEIPVHGRDATGVILAKPDNGDRILAVARNVERNLGADAATVDQDATQGADAEDVTDVATPADDPEVIASPQATDAEPADEGDR